MPNHLASCFGDKESFLSSGKIEVQTIGNLLPDEDDLFSEMIDEFGLDFHASSSDDLFSSSGGMELEENGHPDVGPRNFNFMKGSYNVQEFSGSSIAMQHPTRTLCIREAPSKYQQRFVEYYDVRATEAAACALGSSSSIERPIKLKLSCPNGTTQCFMNRCSSQLAQENLCLFPCKTSVNSLSECISDPTCCARMHGLTNFWGPVMPSSISGRSICDIRPTNKKSTDAFMRNISAQDFGRGIGVRNSAHFSEQHHSCSTSWPKSMSFVDCVQKSSTPQLSRLSGATPRMLNTALATNRCIGSAPTNYRFDIDYESSYPRMSPEAAGFCFGSLGSVGFGGSSAMFQSKVASHVDGTYKGMSKTVPVISQQGCSSFPGRKTATSLGFRSECMENLSLHGYVANPCNDDKKQYELDIGCILRGEDSRTTLMIRNIPNKYTSKMIVAAIDEHHRGMYDFIYLPIDFKNKCNVGYAFINMINPLQIIPFHKSFNGKRWEKFNSEKVVSLAYARIQGRAALISHFQNSSLMNEDKRCRPLLFRTTGPNAGEQEPFPLGPYILSRTCKPRNGINEEDQIPSIYISSNETNSLSDSARDV